jgi:hypothetical protein
MSLLKSELVRAYEFAQTARNESARAKLMVMATLMGFSIEAGGLCLEETEVENE